MARPKPLLKDLKAGKQKKKQQQNLPDPETADEFLAAGVQLEEGGEKWRAGDPVKGMRFFMRAIETYSKGLERYPNNLDLAYNKARTQYEITQHPKLSSQLSASMIEALSVALDSHRRALVLGQDNADVIFNTAQVLTSLAEALTDDGRLMKVARSNISDAGTGEDDARIGRALQCLFEALDLFQRCLSLQEFQVNESEEAMAEAKKLAEAAGVQQEGSNTQQPEEDEKAPDDAEKDSDSKNEQWVSQSEVVTRDSLIDTTVAQFQTLSTLTSLLSGENANELAWVESYSKPIIDEKLSQYSQGAGPEKLEEVGTAKATFIVSLADAFYRVGRLDFKTYRDELTNAFLPLGDISTNPEALVVQAEALVTFSNAIGDNETPTKLQGDLEPTQPTIPGAERYKEAQSLRWQALSSFHASTSRAGMLKCTAGDLATHLSYIPWLCNMVPSF
ncbi:hypothetical protein KEM55_002850 [Ascosphaera atra]|nr:hypothetical protein KEM55_002850 [Ascosphaera atra]